MSVLSSCSITGFSPEECEGGGGACSEGGDHWNPAKAALAPRVILKPITAEKQESVKARMKTSPFLSIRKYHETITRIKGAIVKHKGQAVVCSGKLGLTEIGKTFFVNADPAGPVGRDHPGTKRAQGGGKSQALALQKTEKEHQGYGNQDSGKAGIDQKNGDHDGRAGVESEKPHGPHGVAPVPV